MKVSVELTLDGMIRALRWKAHALADAMEHGYAGPPAGPDRTTKPRPRPPREETDDDRRE